MVAHLRITGGVDIFLTGGSRRGDAGELLVARIGDEQHPNAVIQPKQLVVKLVALGSK